MKEHEMKNREELIAEAANVMSQGYVQDGRISSFFALAEAALAVFEKAQAPTDTVPHVALYHPDGTPKSNDEVRADAAEIRAKYADDASVMGEPVRVQFMARQGGRVQQTIDALFAQANEHGIRVEVVYPQGEPTDAQIEAGATSLDTHRWKTMGVNTVECECGEVLGDLVEDAALRTFPADEVFRAHLAHSVLIAAFTAGGSDV